MDSLLLTYKTHDIYISFVGYTTYKIQCLEAMNTPHYMTGKHFRCQLYTFPRRCYHAKSDYHFIEKDAIYSMPLHIATDGADIEFF